MGGKSEYKNKFNAEKYDRVGLMLPKGKKQKVKEHAEKRSESLNGFIIRAIDEAMQRDEDEEKKINIPAPAKEKQAEPPTPVQLIEVKSAETMSDDEFRERIKALREQHKADGEADGGEQEIKEN